MKRKRIKTLKAPKSQLLGRRRLLRNALWELAAELPPELIDIIIGYEFPFVYEQKTGLYTLTGIVHYEISPISDSNEMAYEWKEISLKGKPGYDRSFVSPDGSVALGNYNTWPHRLALVNLRSMKQIWTDGVNGPVHVYGLFETCVLLVVGKRFVGLTDIAPPEWRLLDIESGASVALHLPFDIDSNKGEALDILRSGPTGTVEVRVRKAGMPVSDYLVEFHFR